MTEIVFRPERAPVVDGLNLYRAWMNRKPTGLLFRARTAADADLMLQVMFAGETAGKTVVASAGNLAKARERMDGNGKEEHQDGD